MHSVLSFPARILPWMAAVISLAVCSVCQDTALAVAAQRSTNPVYKVELSTGQIVSDTFVGTRLTGAAVVASEGLAGWSLVGAADFSTSKRTGMVYSQTSTGRLAVVFYDGSNDTDPLGSSALATPGEGWTAAAVADLKSDGHPQVIFVNKSNGQVDVLSYGGPHGTSLLGRETIGQMSATGWNLVGAANFPTEGRSALILQNPSTRQVLLNFLGGPKGTTVISTEELVGDFAGWTAAGMRDMNGDGSPDLILFNDATGQSKVDYYGGPLGVTSLGTSYLDQAGSPGWKTVVSNTSTSTQTLGTNIQSVGTGDTQGTAQVAFSEATTATTSSVPVLIFNGTGTISNDVTAIESVVSNAGLAYRTANTSQLNGMTQTQLAAYRLFIVPGGNSITIGNYLTSKATSNVRAAVAQNGLNYLGMCAGGFFGGYSKYYNGLDLTSGVWFSFYADYYKGIHKEAVHIGFPSQSALDIYWQNGPELSGWGKVVGKYPNGKPAIVENYVGKGFVILSGVHPEAPASWRTGMNFKTPLDVDLAYARTLVKAALNRTMLPHY